MTIYEQATACIPKNTWDEITEQWKKRHPNSNEYVRLRCGDALRAQEWASRLNYRRIPFVWTGSLPFLSGFGFGAFNELEDVSDLSVDDTNKAPEITFLSVPKEFSLQSLESIDHIEYYNNMIYYRDVPIAVLAKMHEIGKLFTN